MEKEEAEREMVVGEWRKKKLDGRRGGRIIKH